MTPLHIYGDTWPCWVCGHFAEDYEERIGPTTTFQAHMAEAHDLTGSLLDQAQDERQRMHDLRIWVGSESLDVDMLAFPDKDMLDAVGLVSLLGTSPPTQDQHLLRPLLDRNLKEALAEVLDGERLPNALEGLQFAFYIGNVTRVLTHQLVRTRFGAVFVQQSSRPHDMRDAWHRMPITVFGNRDARETFTFQVNEAREAYSDFVDNASTPWQDARYVTPESVCTHIGALYTWPALVELCRKRLRNFMQWETNNVVRAIRQCIRTELPQFASKLVAGCEATSICQQNEDYLQGCGKFPNPLNDVLQWKAPREMSPHGYRFNIEQFGGAP